MALIIPGKFNVIAKARIKRGVEAGTKGWWEETTVEIIRSRSRTIGQLSDQEIKDMITKYAPGSVTWDENPDLFTLHPLDDDRLLFTSEE